MNEAIKILGRLQLGTSPANIYAGIPSPPQAKAKVSCIWICNNDSAIRAVTIRFGVGTLTAADNLFGASPIEAQRTWIIQQLSGLILDAGMVIEGFADVGAKVNVFLFGSELT